MAETALYFPHIRVPHSTWFTQVLLYWDAGAAIVPAGLEHDETVLGSYMCELIRARLVSLVFPDEVLSRRSETFELRFLALLESHQPPAGPAARRWMAVHTGKLSGLIFQELLDRGLARPREGPGWDLWWDVEESTASLYLAYLAGAICGAREGVFPVTDTSRALAALGPPARDPATRLRELRYAAVMRALPAPAHPVPPQELASFKLRHGEQLHRLRRHLDARLAELAGIADDHLRQARIDGVLQELRDEVAVLSEQMARRAWPRVGLAGMGGIVAPALAAASAVVTGGNALALGLAVGSGLASAGGAAYELASAVRSPRFDRRAPLVYAALAQEL